MILIICNIGGNVIFNIIFDRGKNCVVGVKIKLRIVYGFEVS